MIEKKIFFEGDFGKISAYVIRKGLSIVIMVHGFGSNKETSALFCRDMLHQLGYGTLRIDLDNQGESDLDFLTEAGVGNYEKQVYHSIDFALNEGFRKIHLFGSSFGSLPVLLAGLEYESVLSIFLRAPAFDWQRHNLYTFTNNSGDELCNKKLYENSIERFTYLIDNLKNIKQPVAIAQGTADESVDYTVVQKYASLIPQCTLTLIENGNHSLQVNGNNEKELAIVKAFFKKLF